MKYFNSTRSTIRKTASNALRITLHKFFKVCILSILVVQSLYISNDYAPYHSNQYEKCLALQCDERFCPYYDEWKGKILQEIGVAKSHREHLEMKKITVIIMWKGLSS